MTAPVTPRRSSASTVGRAVGLTVAYAAAGLVGTIVAAMLSVPDADVQRGLVLRTVVVGVALVMVTLCSDRRRPLPTLTVIALVAYAVNPAAWNGRAFAAQLWLDPGLATVLVDGVLWVAVVAGAAWLTRAVTGSR